MADQPVAEQVILPDDDELLVPRLVARIAELEQHVFTSELKTSEESGGLLDRFARLLRHAQQGLDAGVAFLVGEVDSAQTQTQATDNAEKRKEALTKEATARSLLITLRKLQSLKEDKSNLQLQVSAVQQQLQEAEAALAASTEKHAALALEMKAVQETAEALSSVHVKDQESLAEVSSELERLQADHQQATTHSSELQLQGAQHAQQLAAQEQAHSQRMAAVTADFEQREAALRQEAAQHAEQVATLRQQLSSATVLAQQLEAQLEASRAEVAGLQGELAGVGEALEALNTEADSLRTSRAAVAQELNETRVKLERARSHAEEFQRRFLQERLERRKVHEQLQVLRGNIRVVCRTRPLVGANHQQGVSFPYPGMIRVQRSDKGLQEFEFDAVFDGSSSQVTVFEEVAPLIRSCADGYNVCIFAYGQTGSGKTHTMQGPACDPGLSVRALQALFEITAREAEEGGQQRVISVSMLEIYNEAVRDLLITGAEAQKHMEVSGLGPGQLQPGQERVPGLTWQSVASVQDVLSVLEEGSKARATACTAMNEHSSRSHALLSVRLSDPSGQTPPTTLHLVDLAGSERIARSEVAGQQLKEAQAINKSLSALGDVISSLQTKNGHIPYRNSKLTQVLQDSLCGSSKVLLVCCVSPEAASAQESLSSLNFASRAAQVELGPVRKVAEAGARKPGDAGAARGSPLTPAASKSRLGTPSSGGIRRSVLRDANTPA